ncbi:MAG: hypothetical protein KGN84_00890, partial [Acidobacteriota bacterium]|nr:hypothetical protein [Acidobacteriota bacterium]
ASPPGATSVITNNVRLDAAKLTYMHAMITYEPWTVTITNGDRFDWLDAEFECSPSPRSGARFTYKTPLVKAGQTVRVPISKFLNANGESMPLADPVDGVIKAKCHTPGGFTGVRTGRFGSTYSPGQTPASVH